MRLTAAIEPLPSGRARTHAPSSYYGWRIVAALAVTETVSWGVLYYAFAVFLVPMQEELGFSRTVLTGAYSLAILLTGLAGVPIGRWIDHHGARGVMTAGSLASVALVVAWSNVQTVTGLYLVFAGIGLASAAVLYEPASAVIVRWFHTDRAWALLVLTLVAGLASTIFLPTSNALLAAHGWRHALRVLAVILAVATVLPHAIVLRRDPTDLGLHPDGAADAPDQSTARSAPSSARLRDTGRWALQDPIYRWFVIGFTANTMAIVIVAVHLVPYFREHGHSAAFAATATGALGALSVTGRLVATAAFRRSSTAAVTATIFSLQGVAVLILLAGGRSGVAAIAFVAIFGLGFGVGTIARAELLAERYGTHSYATLSALINVSLTAGKALAPVAASLTRAAAGSYTPVLIAVAAICGVAAVAITRSDKVDAARNAYASTDSATMSS